MSLGLNTFRNVNFLSPLLQLSNYPFLFPSTTLNHAKGGDREDKTEVSPQIYLITCHILADVTSIRLFLTC